MIFAPPSKQFVRGQSMPNTTPAMDDGSESNSSTVSVGFHSRPKGKLLPPLTPSCSQRKSVSFAMSENVTHEPVINKEICVTLWYTPHDLQAFRTTTVQTILHFRRQEGMPYLNMPPSMVIENTYNACSGMLYEGIDVLCPVETARFRGALHDELFPIGLAAHVSDKIRNDIRKRRAKLHYVMKLIQQATAVDNKEFTHDDLAEVIRVTAEEFSRPSRLFAQLCAEHAYGSFVVY